MTSHRDTVLEAVRLGLGRQPGAPTPDPPPPLTPRAAGTVEEEIDRLLVEIHALSGVAARVSDAEIDSVLAALVKDEKIQRATLWSTARLDQFRIAGRLSKLGVDLVAPDADKATLAACDLGVTEADFALPETGTLGLLSSPDRPRPVSLLPRVHLAIVGRDALRADLHQVFAEAKTHHYLVFVTGPSRTADIELTVTLGVHGPQSLHVWVI